ncbi:class I SAM-dependent methyltransferase [soil metagenome]
MATQAEKLTGSASVQGKLWGAQARGWAELMEQTALPLQGAVLDAARVTRGTRVLDAGCGAGIAAVLASLRGATVSAVDASAELVAITRQRAPGIEVQRADLESLPFEDSTFDSTIAINSVFYAQNPIAAVSELARVTRPGGRIVVTTWGPEERCEYAAAIAALGSLMPPPPSGSKPGGPFALAAPGALEGVLKEAGLHPVDRDEVLCPFVFPNSETSLHGQISSGVAQRAAEHSGLDALRAALEEVDARFTQPDGSIRYDNIFVWVAAVR